MLIQVNDRFAGGRVSKTDLVSWMINYFQSNCLLDCIDALRKDHFDQLIYIQNILKEVKAAQKNGAPPPDLSALLSPITSNQRTRTKRKELQNGLELNSDQEKSV